MNAEAPRSRSHAWLTADDVVQHALAAYYTACANADAACLDPENVASELQNPGAANAYLADNVAEFFSFRLQDQGFRGGVPGFGSHCTDHMKAHAEFFGYVDNSPHKPPQILSESNIHRTL